MIPSAMTHTGAIKNGASEPKELYRIEYGHTCPPASRGRGMKGAARLAAEAMRVGASVDLSTQHAASYLATTLRTVHGRKGGPQIAAVRKVEDGVFRVFRIA